MITPNGRFQINTRLCLSISDFHPDTWNPAWSVATILTGLLSFMVREGGGGREGGREERREGKGCLKSGLVCGDHINWPTQLHGEGR